MNRDPRHACSSYLEGAHQGFIHAHHATCIVKLPTVVGSWEQGHQLPLSKELITVFYHLGATHNPPSFPLSCYASMYESRNQPGVFNSSPAVCVLPDGLCRWGPGRGGSGTCWPHRLRMWTRHRGRFLPSPARPCLGPTTADRTGGLQTKVHCYPHISYFSVVSREDGNKEEMACPAVHQTSVPFPVFQVAKHEVGPMYTHIPHLHTLRESFKDRKRIWEMAAAGVWTLAAL